MAWLTASLMISLPHQALHYRDPPGGNGPASGKRHELHINRCVGLDVRTACDLNHRSGSRASYLAGAAPSVSVSVLF